MPSERPIEADAAAELVSAAVIVPVVDAEADRSLVFTRRAPDLDTHPGQMSFPGGRAEPEDASLQATALRETEEEIGLPRDAVEVVGRLEPIETVTGFHVEAFIGRVPAGPFVPQRSEVAEVVVLPIDAFTRDEHYECEYHEADDGRTVPVHYFHVDGYTVWGATARLLVRYLEATDRWVAPQRR